MLDPMFHNWSEGYFLKTIAKEPPKLKMWLPIIISKMTLLTICGLEKTTMQIQIKIFSMFKKFGQHPFLSIIHMSINNILIIDMVHFSREIKHFQKPTYIRWILWIMFFSTQMSWWIIKC